MSIIASLHPPRKYPAVRELSDHWKRPTDMTSDLPALPWAVRALLLLASALLALTVAAVPAHAHATFSEGSPADGAVLEAAPTEVTLTFDGPVSALTDAIRVLDPSGQRVDTGEIRRPAAGGTVVAVGLQPDLGPGTYLVDWRVVSADSHPLNGAYTFSIGSASATVAQAVGTSGPAGIGTLAVSRFLTFAGLVLLVGGAAFLALCWQAGWQRPLVRRLLWSGWGATVLGTVVGFLAQGPYVTGFPLSRALSGTLLADVATTPYGQALLARLALLLGAAGVLVVAQRRGPGRATLVPAAMLGAGVLLTQSLAGHAGAGDLRLLTTLADWLHLVAMSTWIGGLVLLTVAMAAGPRLAELRVTVPRFSRIALTAVAVLVVTGSFQAILQVGSINALPATPYGRLLLAKLSLVAVIVFLGAESREWVQHHAGPQDPTGPSDTAELTDAAELRGLRVSVLAEMVIAAAVLGVTAVLVGTTPAKNDYRPETEAIVVAGPAQVEVRVVPAGERRVSVRVDVYDEQGARLAVPEMTADLTHTGRDIGPLAVPLRPAGPGIYVTDPRSVPMTGKWSLAVHVRTSEIDAYTQTLPVTIR